MTGFGSAFATFEGTAGARRVDVEVRSVNARFLEVRAKHPFDAAVGDRVTRAVKAALGRGRVEVRVVVSDPVEAGAEVVGGVPSEAALEAACRATAAAAEVGERCGVKMREADPCALVRLARSFEDDRGHGGGRPEAPACLDTVVGEALAGLEKMRIAEGEVVAEALRTQAQQLRETHRALCQGIAGAQAAGAEGLRARAQELLSALGEGALDEARLLAEVATLATRGDVTEELDRIESHLDQMDACLEAAPSRGQGKTLDFLCQELGREFTTTGSKLASGSLCAIVIEGKGALERLREQAQNVE